MKDKIKDKIQVFSGAMMIPIILIVAAGLTIGLGSAFINMENVKFLHLDWLIQEGNFIYNFFYMLVSVGFMIMGNLPVFFAVGVTMGLCKREKGWGALAGFVLYLGTNYILNVFLGMKGITAETASIDALVQQGYSLIDAQKENALYGTVLGIFSYNTSVFGAILIAFVASYIHNKLWDKELKPALSFFGGVRLVQLTVVVATIPLGILFFYIWPPFAGLIQNLGSFIANTGLFGTFLFGALDRGLLPLGLHHLIAFPIEYTPLSGTMVVEGIEYFGVRNIMTAQLADPAATGFITRNFTSGRILLHFAGLPAAALAMYHSAKKENRKKLRSLLIPVTLTCMLIGVTEPLEFTFVYTAPILYYLIHVPLAGLSYVLTEVLNVSIYGFAVWNMWPNLLQPGKVHAMALLFLLPLYFGLYYVSFKWGIKQFKAAVPGQGVDKSVKLYSKKDYHAAKTEAQSVANNGAGGAPTDTTTSESVQVDTDGVKQVTPAEVTAQAEPPTLALRIIEALGGAKNIENVTNCATRLRVTLYDGTLVAPKEIWQNTLDARGIIIRDSGVQVIYGTQVEGIARSVKTELDME